MRVSIELLVRDMFIFKFVGKEVGKFYNFTLIFQTALHLMPINLLFKYDCKNIFILLNIIKLYFKRPNDLKFTELVSNYDFKNL